MIKAAMGFALSTWSIFTVMTLIFLIHLWASMPTEYDIKNCMITQMNQIDLCPSNKNYVQLNQVSKHLRNAILISEDGNFYSHNGFDFEELKQSFRKNIEKQKFVRGGSTITQQLAKNMFLSSEKSLVRKTKEAVITYQLERTLDKNQIFEKYLNIVEFGPQVYGIRAAALHYFKKAPSNLTVLESSFLAMLLPNPAKYSISFQKKKLTRFARSRVNQIINRMFDFNKIGSDQYAIAKINLDSFPWDGHLLTESAMENKDTEIIDETIPEDEEDSSEELVEDFGSEYL